MRFGQASTVQVQSIKSSILRESKAILHCPLFSIGNGILEKWTKNTEKA